MAFEKLLYFDTETGGLNPELNPVLSLSGCIYNLNKDLGQYESEEFNFFTSPPSDYVIEASALTVNNMTLDFIRQQESYSQTYEKLVNLFDKYIDKYNRNNKFTLIAYNSDFDVSFLEAFFKYHKNNFLFSYISHYTIDVYELVKHVYYLYNLPLENLKLSTVCKYFGIEHKAHISMSDVHATLQLYNKLTTTYMKGF